MNEQRKKQMIIAGALVAVVAVVLVFLVFGRRGGQEPLGSAQPMTSAEAPAGGAAAPSAPATGMGAMGASARPGGVPAAAPTTAAAGGNIGSPLHPPADAKQPPFKARPDPFKAFPLPKEWLEALQRMAKAAEPPPIYGWGVPAAEVKTAQVTRSVESGPSATLSVAGARRMSGILFDGRVWAILETEDGQSHVVKPGDVMENGAKVAAVSRDSMVISRAGQRQNVELKGRPAPAATAATAASGVTPVVPGTGRVPGGMMGGATAVPMPPGPPGSAVGGMEEL
jgi:hypothetical protein